MPEDLIEQLDKLHADLNDMNLWRQDVDVSYLLYLFFPGIITCIA